jgi:phenazine biosynthesis protein phzE
MTTATAGLRQSIDLSGVIHGHERAFALLHRPQSGRPDRVEVLLGEAVAVDSLASLPLPTVLPHIDRPDVLAVLPYRQLVERGFACRDDGTPLMALMVRDHGEIGLAEAIAALPAVHVAVERGGFDVSDRAYAEMVRRIVAEEIGRGEGSNFVLRRSFVATVTDYSPATALAVFRRLLAGESGAYWTFLVRLGNRTLVGASPERHVSLRDGTATMSPISGTYRYPPGGARLRDVLRFLADRKETDELYMVVDEELKMMGQVCHSGGQLRGPELLEMAHLAHTGYRIEGRTALDVPAILRRTMFAPTVTGSPVESACRVIARAEPRGRGYYGGVLALVGQRRGRRTLDSAIAIRTADIDGAGNVAVGAGATLVRHSDPEAEAAETRAKVAGLLVALGVASPRAGHAVGRGAPGLAADPRVDHALTARNRGLSRFWLTSPDDRRERVPDLAGRRILIIDAEDAFTAMLAHQTRALGATVTVRAYHRPGQLRNADAVIMGPGPGDPRDRADPRIGALWELAAELVRERIPSVSVCLGHQVLSALLGLEVRRRQRPAQGLRRTIDHFGRREMVGFYNTFAAYSATDAFDCTDLGAPVEVSRDRRTGEVHGLRGPRLRSVQFHLESVLTVDGPRILSELLLSVLSPAALPVADVVPVAT